MSSITLSPPKGNTSLAVMRTLMAKTVKIPSATFTGQTIIITGSNTGIGFECAKLLLTMNVSRLIIAVRNVQKGKEAVSTLQNKDSAVIEVWPLDMSSYDSIQAFAKKCDTLDRIHAAVLNAGFTSPEWNIAPSGHEEMPAVAQSPVSCLLRWRECVPSGQCLRLFAVYLALARALPEKPNTRKLHIPQPRKKIG